MEPENDQPQPMEPSGTAPEIRRVRVRKRKRISPESRKKAVSKRRRHQFWKSAPFWAVMNVVTAIVTYVCVTWPGPTAPSLTEIPPLPPSEKPGLLDKPHVVTEVPQEHTPETSTSPVETKPAVPVPGKRAGLATFFGKQSTQDEGLEKAIPTADPFVIPKEFHPESLTMGEETESLAGGQLPDAAGVSDALRRAAEARGKFDFNGAMQHYETALRMDPKSAAAMVGLGETLRSLRRVDEAVARFFAALRVDPNNSEALDNLAWIFATSENPAYRNGARAVEWAERACKLSSYTNSAHLDSLAAAYAESGRFPEAIDTAAKALELARKTEPKESLEGIQTRLDSYKAGKAFHVR